MRCNQKTETMHTSTVKTDLALAGGKFNNAQLEVLKIFNHSISEGQLIRLRTILVDFMNEIVQEEISAKISSGDIDLQAIQNPDLHYRSHIKA